MNCARNIVTASFSGGGTSATTAPLWQWDYGQALCVTGIEDLPAAFEVHFSTNRTGGVSTVAVGADGQVTIPNVLLTIGKTIYAWIYLSDAQGEGETEYSITIPVKARPMPETYDAEVSGEFDDVVRQVSEYAQSAQTAADNAGASATAAAGSASAAEASASSAAGSASAAEQARADAVTAKGQAETAAQTATQKAQQTAQSAEQAASNAGRAESAANRAEAAQTGADSAKTAAQTAAQDAFAAASAANASATSAGQAATSAARSASSAAGSATTASNAAQTATTKAGEASASATAAAASATAAQTAQTAAETAATNAGQSASTATTKASEAAQSASSAAQSKTDAEAAATRAETAAASLTVDDALSDSSTNPVENKVITGELTNVKSAFDYTTERNKNLLPIYNKSTSLRNVPVSYTPGKVSFAGTANSDAVAYDYSACEPFALPAGTYTFSRNTAVAQEVLRKVSGTATTNVAILQGSTNSAMFTLSEETTLYLYIALTNGATYDAEVQLQVEAGQSATYWVAPVLSSVDVYAREDATHKSRLTLAWTTGKAFVYNAGWTNNSGWEYSDIILKQGEALIVTAYTYTTVYTLSVWSGDGNSIIRPCSTLPDEAGTYTHIYICQSDSERVRVNVRTTYERDVVVYIYNVGDMLNKSNSAALRNAVPCYDVLYGSIIAIGDSLTQGSYTGSDLHEGQSYPAFLAELMRSTVTNAGRAGWSTLEWWTGNSASQKGFPFYDFSGYDSAIICLGTNGGLTDTLATDVDPYDDYTNYADTNTGAYCKIIEGILAQNSGISIFLCNIWAGGGTVGVDVTNTVIDKIAAKYSLPVIDLKTELGSSYSVYHAVSRNIHLGRIGYAKMAGIVRGVLNSYVMTAPAQYNYIPQ